MTLPHELGKAYLEMIQDIKPNAIVGLATFAGCQLSDHAMLDRLTHFDACVARRALGHNWASKPDSDRIQGVFVLEHARSGTHPHWHGLVRLPEEHLLRYRQLMINAWRQYNYSSWVNINPQDVEKYTSGASYILKEVQDISTDRIVFLNMLRG